MMTKQNQEKKRVYCKPALVKFGAVKELTKGNGGTGSVDANNTMTMASMA